MKTHFQLLLQGLFMAQGAEECKAALHAQAAWDAIQLIPGAKVPFSIWEDGELVYHLRGKGLRPCEIVIRTGKSRTQVFRMTKIHGTVRRDILKLVA